ncbi:unnamed protein product [Chilo suppressalis]|uniref:Zinc finger CCCH domain-containing protein 14 n=1 Tax=Chilo suppressalis TaxID=168631 RepID=A0ABN8B147_CHISP|nr:unnamed protein product [Chilo suppressalis]
MDVVGSEIGQKMRSAIKAKLTELGCYVDDELPDYVMVMVANKRTRTQMEDDLQLFLGDNTNLFVNWLHQVLKKLQEVTVTTPLKTIEHEVIKEKSSSKEKKSKDKKDKDKDKTKKTESAKKAKKKEKSHRKKEDKKLHKSKKKSKHHERIRPNVPPLLMNMEKESEPSITDVFAGQILKSHGITLESLKDEPKIPDVKPVLKEIKRPIVPIIDPATISSQLDVDSVPQNPEPSTSQDKGPSVSSPGDEREQLDEINVIEAKIQGLKQKLVEQLDSMSDDEDFLTIRTEAEELMNDFAEDVFQEISKQAPVATPPLTAQKSPPKESAPKPVEIPNTIETLPHIELNLPKRPIRERLGAREEPKKPEAKEREPEKRRKSPERFTPEREPERSLHSKSDKSRLSDHKISSDSEESESSSKRINSRVSVLESRPSRVTCASVVRVRPRPRVAAPASSLLLRAVADAHKSLLNIPPKVDQEQQKIKRALVLPMRRVGDPKIVIQVPTGECVQDSDNVSLGDSEEEKDKLGVSSRDDYMPKSIKMKIKNTNYVPSTRNEGRTASRRDDSLIIETINIHNPTVDKDKNTQFIVTMDGFNPNAFLAKKLMTEGLLNEGDEVTEKPKETTSVLKTISDINTKEDIKSKSDTKTKEDSKTRDEIETTDDTNLDAAKTKELSSKAAAKSDNENTVNKSILDKKRLSNESEESETRVIVKQEVEEDKTNPTVGKPEKRKSLTLESEDNSIAKKRKASPIVFDVPKKEKEAVKARERTESVSSDSHVIVKTATNTHKYDSVPPLSAADRKSGTTWCRSFPLCRFGSACAFQHPRCKFNAACTRRGCVYSHVPTSPVPAISSHVVPAANYKTISASSMANMCKFYPNCVNPACLFYHPKPCRYGPNCLNKLECNFYHSDLPTTKWRYPV